MTIDVLPEAESVSSHLEHMEFRGFWEEADKIDAVEPWETFHVRLYGTEAGDWLETRAEISEALRASGYELRLIKVADDG